MVQRLRAGISGLVQSKVGRVQGVSLAGRREVRALRHRNRTRREDFLRRGAFRRYRRVRSKDREDGNHKNSHSWIDRAKYVGRQHAEQIVVGLEWYGPYWKNRSQVIALTSSDAAERGRGRLLCCFQLASFGVPIRS